MISLEEAVAAAATEATGPVVLVSRRIVVDAATRASLVEITQTLNPTILSDAEREAIASFEVGAIVWSLTIEMPMEGMTFSMMVAARTLVEAHDKMADAIANMLSEERRPAG